MKRLFCGDRSLAFHGSLTCPTAKCLADDRLKMFEALDDALSLPAVCNA
jgi:hypothetical protein